MIEVHVLLHTILQRETPDGPLRHLDVQLPDGSDLQDLLMQLEIELEADQILLVVNGRLAAASQVLEQDDQISLMPALSGG